MVLLKVRLKAVVKASLMVDCWEEPKVRTKVPYSEKTRVDLTEALMVVSRDAGRVAR